MLATCPRNVGVEVRDGSVTNEGSHSNQPYLENWAISFSMMWALVIQSGN